MLLDPPPTGCRCGGCSPTLDCAEAPLRTAGPPGRTSFRPRAKHRSNLGSQGRELHWLMEATITMHLGWAPPKLYPNFPGFLSCNVLRVLTCPPTPKNLLRTLDQGAERSLAPASPPARQKPFLSSGAGAAAPCGCQAAPAAPAPAKSCPLPAATSHAAAFRWLRGPRRADATPGSALRGLTRWGRRRARPLPPVPEPGTRVSSSRLPF